MLDMKCLPQYEWLNVPIWVYDTDAIRIIWANTAALSFWQATSLEELLQRDFSDVSEAAQTRLESMMHAHRRGQTVREYWTLYPKGLPITSMLVSRGIHLDRNRQGILFASEPLANNFDADTLRGIEALQHTSLRIALHKLPEGRVMMRNPAAARCFGMIHDKGKKKHNDFADMFPDPALSERIINQVRKGQTFNAEIELQTLQGLRWHSLDVRPVLDPITGVQAMQVNTRDITDLKNIQKALEIARVAADNANMAKSTFLATMSHEIRTPMNGVLGLTELALKTHLDERQRRFIQLANQSARGLMVILDDLLDMAKIEAGQLVLENRLFSLKDCLNEALAPFTVNAQEKNIQLTVHVDADISSVLKGDDVRLRQILINLIGNALKFTKQGNVNVEVKGLSLLSESHQLLEFKVSDTGIGMTADQLKYVFQPFTQADNTIARRYGGTGLGLAIVQRLIKLMQGEMQVTSHPGQGSCFSFTAPLELYSPLMDTSFKTGSQELYLQDA
jgi:signal transduction histidine kinase